MSGLRIGGRDDGVWETYPEVGRSGIKVEVEGLARGSNRNGAEIFRVVLHVLSTNFADVAIGKLLLEDGLHGGFAADELVLAVFALLVHPAAHEVGAFHGRLEGIFVHEEDVGLGAGALVLGVVDEFDAVEAAGSHDCGWFEVVVWIGEALGQE